MKIRSFLLSWVTILTLSACSVNPVNEADTFEQKSYALYGTYVIYQGKAAELVKDPSVPAEAKRALSRIDALSYPVAESLIEAATVVTDTRELLEKCQNAPPAPEAVEVENCKNTSEEKLNLAIMNLSKIYFDAKPKLLAVKTAFDSAKKTASKRTS
jgi:hypothetical protein